MIWTAADFELWENLVLRDLFAAIEELCGRTGKDDASE